MAYQGQSIPHQGQSNIHEPHTPKSARGGSSLSTNSTSTMTNEQPSRPRGSTGTQSDGYSSDSNRYHQARQPIKEAVTSAFHANDPAVANIPDELLHHLTTTITASVITQLKSGNIPLPVQGQFPTTIPADSGSSTTGSPPVDRAAVYTPPSPYRGAEEAGQQHSIPNAQVQYPAPSNQPRPEPSASPMGKRAFSPFSHGSHADDSDTREDRATRPPPPTRGSTDGTTIYEKVWGVLFSDQGEPTPRLGQFLRGIAIHLIDEYEPKGSLVVTPNKMQRYYQEMGIDNEIYLWQIVFDDRTSSISRMFRDLEAQHHLVQDHRLHERPDIPGLTPQGFERWMTLVLKAHPDQEFERLAKTALNMPVSNPDDRSERFPKQIARKMFPKEVDIGSETKIQKAMAVHCNVKPSSSRNPSSTLDPKLSSTSRNEDSSQSSPNLYQTRSNDKQDIPPVQPRDSPPQKHSNFETQQKPLSQPPSEIAVEDDDATPTPQPPIERERKPYVGQSGGGKNYDYIDKDNAPLDSKNPMFDSQSMRSPSMSSNNGRPREFSKPRPPPISIHQKSNPVEIPDSRMHRSNSAYQRDLPPRSGRNRSPSISKEGSFSRRSDCDTSSFGGSYHSAASVEYVDDPRRYRDYEPPKDRHDNVRIPPYDPRDGRPRGQSIAGYDSGRTHHPMEEEFYRGTYAVGRDGYQAFPPGVPAYPPSAYRETR